MPLKTIVTGALLISLSVLLNIVSDDGGNATWLPAVFGGLLALLGIVALANKDLRHHAMHGAAAVALIMVVVTLVRIITSGTSGWEAVRQIAMLAVGAGFIAMAVGSFREARAARKLAPEAPDTEAS